ncbi:hypothetical protein L195_g059477 [Trifolium pratense]|uniref:Uncharacterized protein n=1 Tax=Trifolium pratense TaxID=57577 RepID=A0A2K3JY94_TRIPR|nr:hypothetical protein L195_g059477 [Trifolium pratense]
MGRIADFFGTPTMPNQNLQPIRNQTQVQHQGFRVNNEVPNDQIPQVVQEEPPAPAVHHVPEPEVILVNRNQNADEVGMEDPQIHKVCRGHNRVNSGTCGKIFCRSRKFGR